MKTKIWAIGTTNTRLWEFPGIMTMSSANGVVQFSDTNSLRLVLPVDRFISMEVVPDV